MNRTIRFFAWLDLAVTGLFALPFTAPLLIDLAYWLHDALPLAPLARPVLGDTAMAFVNIMGIIGVIWALARLKAPSLLLARLDGWGRLAVAAVLLWYMTGTLSPVFGLFVLTELAGAAAQLKPGFRRSVKT